MTEFQDLVKGQFNVADYEAKFTELCRYASQVIGTKKKKARKFQEGLVPYLHHKLVPLMIEDYVGLMRGC